MNTSLDLNRLIFDPAGADGYGSFDSNTIGSFVIDGYGNQITSSSLVAGAIQALDVNALLSDGYGNLISSLNGSLNVNLTNNGSPLDTNYGVVGANTLRTASQIGNATGAADFNVGAPTAQTLRVVADLADGYGNQISSTNGSLNVSLTTSGGGPLDTNYGTVGANTLRTASQIGNATGQADFNVGAPTAQTLRVVSDLADGYGNQISSLNGALNVNVTNSAATSYAEDSPHTSGDLGDFILAVRNDADIVLTSNDLDYSPIAVDAYGRIKTTVRVEPSDAEFIEGALHISNDVGLHGLTVVKTDSNPVTSTDGEYSSFFVDAYGNLKVVASFDPSLVSNNHLQVTLDTVADDAPDAYNPIKVGSRSAPGPLAPLSNSNDRADLISDLYRRIYINDSCNIGLQSSDAGVFTANVAVQIAASSLGGRRRMIVQNTSNKQIYLGDVSVTTADGLEIRAGQSMNLDIGPDVDVYVVCGSNLVTGSVRVFELA